MNAAIVYLQYASNRRGSHVGLVKLPSKVKHLADSLDVRLSIQQIKPNQWNVVN